MAKATFITFLSKIACMLRASRSWSMLPFPDHHHLWPSGCCRVASWARGGSHQLGHTHFLAWSWGPRVMPCPDWSSQLLGAPHYSCGAPHPRNPWNAHRRQWVSRKRLHHPWSFNFTTVSLHFCWVQIF